MLVDRSVSGKYMYLHLFLGWNNPSYPFIFGHLEGVIPKLKKNWFSNWVLGGLSQDDRVWFITMVIVFIPRTGLWEPLSTQRRSTTNPSDSKWPTSFPAEILRRGFSKIPPRKKKNDSNNCSKFPMLFGYFFGEEVLAPGQKMFDLLAENLNPIVINIFSTQTMHSSKGNPSKLPYVCIIWSLQNGSHLVTPYPILTFKPRTEKKKKQTARKPSPNVEQVGKVTRRLGWQKIPPHKMDPYDASKWS